MQTYENEDLAKVLKDGIKKVFDRLGLEMPQQQPEEKESEDAQQ